MNQIHGFSSVWDVCHMIKGPPSQIMFQKTDKNIWKKQLNSGYLIRLFIGSMIHDESVITFLKFLNIIELQSEPPPIWGHHHWSSTHRHHPVLHTTLHGIFDMVCRSVGPVPEKQAQLLKPLGCISQTLHISHVYSSDVVAILSTANHFVPPPPKKKRASVPLIPCAFFQKRSNKMVKSDSEAQCWALFWVNFLMFLLSSEMSFGWNPKLVPMIP